jgi:hypothetical protein
VGKTVDVRGPGASQLAISGGDGVTVFVLHGSATMSGLKIERGSSLLGGCIFNGAGTLTLEDATVSDCTGQLGGGIFNSGTLNLVRTTLRNNFVGLNERAGVGGGILNYGGTVTATDSVIDANYSTCSGDAAVDYVRGCGGGGGIYNTSAGSVTLTRSAMTDNYSTHGGAILNLHGTVLLTDSTVAGNNAGGSGGG